MSGVVDENRAIGIAVERHSEMRLLLDDDFPEAFRMEGTGAFIDVAAIGLIVDDANVRADSPEDFRSDAVCRSVSGIQHDVHSTQRIRSDATDQEVLIFLDERVILTQLDLRNRDVVTTDRAHLIFDFFFAHIRNLHSVMAEDLHPVVIVGIVRCRDRDSRFRIGRATKIGNAGCGDDPDESCLTAAGDDSCRQRACDVGA